MVAFQGKGELGYHIDWDILTKPQKAWRSEVEIAQLYWDNYIATVIKSISRELFKTNLFC